MYISRNIYDIYQVPGRYCQGGDGVAGVAEQQSRQHRGHVQADLNHV